jgi:predicted Zn-dependent protease
VIVSTAAESRRPWRPYLVLLLITFLTFPVLSGCASRSADNPHDDFVLVGSRESEKETGQYVLDKLKKNDALYHSDTYTQYVDNIGSRVAVYSDWTQIEYQFHILRTFEINAFAAPGGYIFVTRGLLNEMETEAELAGVLAHEVGHVAARHHAKRKQMQFASLLASIAVASQGGARAAQGSLMASRVVQLSYSRSQERQADRLGLEYSARAGYDPRGLIQFLKTLREIQGQIPVRDMVFLQTHPYLTDRIGSARVNVSDYLDLAPDTPIVNRYEYRRARRRWLFKDAEEEVLERTRSMISAYENQDTAGIKAHFHEEFRLDLGDTEADADQFLSELAGRFDQADTIDYQFRLLNIDMGDTDATVTYEYRTRQWDYGAQYPSYRNGFQRLIWRREDSSWKLIRLR